MAEYVGSAAPQFKVTLNFAARWPSNMAFSMVDRVILEFPTQDQRFKGLVPYGKFKLRVV